MTDIDGSSGSALVAGVYWIALLLTGSVATIAATIGIAIIGLKMLGGRLPWRRGARAILGCFLIFGASMVARGLLLVAPHDTGMQRLSTNEAMVMPPPPPKPQPYDPYASVALPEDW